MNIAGSSIADGSVYFIAEAGVNHNGDLAIARDLIDAANSAGADAVKFQAYNAEKLVARDAPKAAYQEETVDEKSHLEMLKEYELSRSQQRELIDYCAETGITFLSTPFDRANAEFLNDQGLAAIKLGSGELNNWPLLETVAAFDLPAIVSTGMGTMSEVVDAYEIFARADAADDVAFLHCTSAYPAATEHVNLRAMESMRTALPTPIGYSDHTTAVETPALAVAAGAQIVEKHLTLDQSMDGPDHRASMEPDGMAEAISLARMATELRGRPDKRPTPAEDELRTVARKSLHADAHIEAGEKFTSDNISIKRPARGLSPTEYQSVIGSKSTRPLEPDDPITSSDVRW